MFEKIATSGQLRAWPGKIPMKNRYTAGIAGEKFLRGLRDRGEILGSRCEACDYTYVPPMIYCERCFSGLGDMKKVGPKGTVVSYTIARIDSRGASREKPRVVAAIRLDGASSVLIHFIGGARAEAIEIGRRVEAVFAPKGKRKGSILDIVHFEPLRDGQKAGRA